jgi:SRSO17 transposase
MPPSRSWLEELKLWLAPFLEALSHKKQRRWAPFYVEGLLRPGRRKSVEPMAERVAPGEVQQLHNFVSTSRWDGAPLGRVLTRKAEAMVGGPSAHLIVDDTALVKKGKHSVGVAHQYCGELGKKANCQTLVTLTLARGEVPVPIALKLFLPEAWAQDKKRRARAYVPEGLVHRPKWKIALEEIDHAIADGATFGDVLADAGYGMCAEFRKGLSQRRLRWAVGILSSQKVYAADVKLAPIRLKPQGRPRKHRRPTAPSRSAQQTIQALGSRAFRSIAWRRGTKGELRARFACARVRVADGEKGPHGQHQPGEELWLIAEHRATGERKYYLSNLPASTTRKELAATIKARWVCEQGHQQMKQELGLDHFEGRSWHGLHHHALLVMIAYAFGQRLRLGEKKGARRRTAPTQPARGAASTRGHPTEPSALPSMPMRLHLSPKRMRLAE